MEAPSYPPRFIGHPAVARAAAAAATALLMVAASTQAAPAMAPEESQPVAAAKVTMRPGDNIVYAAAAAAAKRKWLFGKPSHTYEQSPVTGTIYVSTLEQVGYRRGGRELAQGRPGVPRVDLGRTLRVRRHR